jgi:hypothetical protein
MMITPEKKIMTTTVIAIIGTSGRSNTKDLSLALFESMVESAANVIKDAFGLEPANCSLVSGGAAWSDHVAVTLFLQGKVAGLTVYAPCSFQKTQFIDTGIVDWRSNPGGTANYYHRRFSKCIGRNTLDDIERAIQKGAVLDASHQGFHARNMDIATQATHMIAFSWSESGAPTDGGTLDTWKNCPLPSEKKVHVGLGRLLETKSSSSVSSFLEYRMTKRPFPYDDATMDECVAKRARLTEKLQAVNARLRALEPPKEEAAVENGPPCKDCGGLSVCRISRSAKNPDRKFWSCPAGCKSWIGWADAPVITIGTCNVCKHSRKFGATGEAIPTHVKAAIADGTYECEKCAEDGKF